MKRKNNIWNRLDEKLIRIHTFLVQKNGGMGTVEIILIIVVIFTIYKGCK